MTLQEKSNVSLTDNLRQNAIRQEDKVSLSPFNYCFLVYYYLIKEIIKYAPLAKGTLLDVGCGSCPFENYFKRHVDKYLKHDHPLAAKENITYDYLSELPEIKAPSQSFDTIICISVLEHVSEPFETIKEFKRVLRDDGIIMLYLPQYWHLHEEPFDFHRFTKYIIDKKLKDIGFETTHIKEVGKSFAVVGQAFSNALVLLFDLKHVKNIFSFVRGEKIDNISRSILYAIYKSPLIFLYNSKCFNKSSSF